MQASASSLRSSEGIIVWPVNGPRQACRIRAGAARASRISALPMLYVKCAKPKTFAMSKRCFIRTMRGPWMSVVFVRSEWRMIISGPRQRERALRGAARRKSHWLDRRWRISSHGNAFINTDGFNVAIFQNGDGSWGGRISEQATERFILSRRRYESEDKAKLAAFDGMIFLKHKRGWGR
jgi:hypothetical protein